MHHHYSLNQHKIVHKIQPVHKEIPLNQTEIRLLSPISDRFGTGNGRPIGRPFQINRKTKKYNPTSVRLNTISLRVVNQQYQFLIIIML